MIKEKLRRAGFTLAAGCFALCISTAAHAATVGFSLVFSGNTNTPNLSLTNDSSTAVLTQFTLSIGDTGFNFDLVGNLACGGCTATLNDPDGNDSGGLRTDLMKLSFSGFDPGETASWRTDIDQDTANTIEDYSVVLFNNMIAPNSIATATFNDGNVLAFVLPDGSPDEEGDFVFSPSKVVSAVPLPGALPLLAGGLGLMGLFGWRRRRKTAVAAH